MFIRNGGRYIHTVSQSASQCCFLPHHDVCPAVSMSQSLDT